MVLTGPVWKDVQELKLMKEEQRGSLHDPFQLFEGGSWHTGSVPPGSSGVRGRLLQDALQDPGGASTSMNIWSLTE